MSTVIKNRQGKVIINGASQEKWLSFLYQSVPGRVLLKGLTKPVVSKAAGAFMNSKLSTGLISGFIKKNHIQMSDYETCRYQSYNEFFTRKIKKGKRIIDERSNSFISPCDAKLSVYKINETNAFHIKNSVYTIKDLLNGDPIYQEFQDGYCLIFRLTVDDYHRYSYFDDGRKGRNTFVPGELHTVNPIALAHCNIYKRNCREYSILETKNFGTVAQIEVGAMMVGKIKNHHEEYSFKRGEEKGMFEFGGSTIVLLMKKDSVIIDSDIVKNSVAHIETVVKLGEKIGYKMK